MNEIPNEDLRPIEQSQIGSANKADGFDGLDELNKSIESNESVKSNDSLKQEIPIDKKPDDQTVNQMKVKIELKPKYVNLVLGSGSIKAISHIGAVQKLIDEGLIDLKKLESLAGSSAGSLIGCLIVLGFSSEEIWNFMLCLDFKKLVSPNIMLFLKKCGVDTGAVIYNLFEEILTKKTGIKNITFKKLFELTQKTFTVVGSCLTTKEAIYYNHTNTPNFEVSLAIRISISMPGFFVPIEIDGKKYIDGAVLNNYPMNLYKNELDKTIGIIICNEYDTDYEYPEQYFMALMNLFFYHYFDETRSKYFNNTVYIKKDCPKLNIFNFNIDDEVKHILYQSGVSAAEEFITRVGKS